MVKKNKLYPTIVGISIVISTWQKPHEMLVHVTPIMRYNLYFAQVGQLAKVKSVLNGSRECR